MLAIVIGARSVSTTRLLLPIAIGLNDPTVRAPAVVPSTVSATPLTERSVSSPPSTIMLAVRNPAPWSSARMNRLRTLSVGPDGSPREKFTPSAGV